jgi:AraC-like DNA-binding protein
VGRIAGTPPGVGDEEVWRLQELAPPDRGEGGRGTVAAIAIRWGSPDAAHFTRTHKHHFGERPRDTVARTWAHRECLRQHARGPG